MNKINDFSCYVFQTIEFLINLQFETCIRMSPYEPFLSSFASLHTWSQLVLAYFLDRKLEYFSIGSLFKLLTYNLVIYVFISEFYHEDIPRFKQFCTSQQI